MYKYRVLYTTADGVDCNSGLFDSLHEAEEWAHDRKAEGCHSFSCRKVHC